MRLMSGPLIVSKPKSEHPDCLQIFHRMLQQPATNVRHVLPRQQGHATPTPRDPTYFPLAPKAETHNDDNPCKSTTRLFCISRQALETFAQEKGAPSISTIVAPNHQTNKFTHRPRPAHPSPSAPRRYPHLATGPTSFLER
jgi:hypothetical protein